MKRMMQCGSVSGAIWIRRYLQKPAEGRTASERFLITSAVLYCKGEVSESVPDFGPILWITVYVSSFYSRKLVSGLVVCFLRQLCTFLCGRHKDGENHKADECGNQSGKAWKFFSKDCSTWKNLLNALNYRHVDGMEFWLRNNEIK